MTHASPKPSPDPTPFSETTSGVSSTSPIVQDRQFAAFSRVASVVAHELTNLLQILASSLDRLEPSVRNAEFGVDTDEAVSAMQTIRSSMDRSTRVARQLQTFAQTTPPRLQPRELHQLMAGWMQDFEDTVGTDTRLELRLRHSGSVLVDADQLHAALLNLLANAREASSPGALILLELSRVARANGLTCRIAVIDHGEGMSEEVVRQATAPFYTTRPPGKGMGLGLTIARMVVEAHGGSMEIDSTFGRGTTVALYLPLPGGNLRHTHTGITASAPSTPGSGASASGTPASASASATSSTIASPFATAPSTTAATSSGVPAQAGEPAPTSASAAGSGPAPSAASTASGLAAASVPLAAGGAAASTPTASSDTPGASSASSASTPAPSTPSLPAPAPSTTAGTPAAGGAPWPPAPSPTAAPSGFAGAGVAAASASAPSDTPSASTSVPGAPAGRPTPSSPIAAASPSTPTPTTNGAAGPPIPAAPPATAVTPPTVVGLQPSAPAPASAPAAPAATSPFAPSAPVHTGPTPLRAAPRSAGCVLVIDDEEAIAEYFRIILAAERYDVHVVTSAHLALERFAEDPQRYDAVLLDMMLRDGSGIDLYRSFRALRPDLRVVVCTGFSDNESLAPIRADGHDILYKPCPRSEVLKAIARAVTARRAAV